MRKYGFVPTNILAYSLIGRKLAGFSHWICQKFFSNRNLFYHQSFRKKGIKLNGFIQKVKSHLLIICMLFGTFQSILFEWGGELVLKRH